MDFRVELITARERRAVVRVGIALVALALAAGLYLRPPQPGPVARPPAVAHRSAPQAPATVSEPMVIHSVVPGTAPSGAVFVWSAAPSTWSISGAPQTVTWSRTSLRAGEV